MSKVYIVVPMCPTDTWYYDEPDSVWDTKEKAIARAEELKRADCSIIEDKIDWNIFEMEIK